jgi:hypothetical protein
MNPKNTGRGHLRLAQLLLQVARHLEARSDVVHTDRQLQINQRDMGEIPARVI